MDASFFRETDSLHQKNVPALSQGVTLRLQHHLVTEDALHRGRLA